MNQHTVIKQVVEALNHKKKAALLALITEDAVFFDPHYPTAEMKGKQMISEGLDWAFGNIKEFRFKELHFLEDEKGQTASVEYHCSHLLPNGQQLDFKQLFLFETQNKLIHSLRVYLPYGPGGLSGFLLKISHMVYKIKGSKYV